MRNAIIFESIDKQLRATVTVIGKLRVKKHLINAMHRHSFPEIHYINSNNVTLYIDKTKHNISGMNIFFIQSNTPHRILSAGPTECFHMGFDIMEWGRFQKKSKYTAAMRLLSQESFICKTSPVFLILFDKVFNEINEIKSGLRKILTKNIFKFFIYVLADMEKQKKRIYRYAPVVQKVTAFIEKNLALKKIIGRISSDNCISVRQLHFIFKESTGKTPKQYQQELRIAYAKKLLRQGFLSKNIYKKLGFHDVCHFYKTFQNITGKSVGEYRRM